MFVETSNHESLPNPGCKLCDEYEFVGRIIGKAVYEGINIEQKFAEPFINLVIGRQNTFEDMQYVDPIIYNNLLKIKHLEEDVRNFELTFTIFDTLPDGARQSVNLLCPSRPSKEEEEVYVTK